MNHKGATHFTLNDRQTLERMLRKGFSNPRKLLGWKSAATLFEAELQAA
jgi:IS30 family transposase